MIKKIGRGRPKKPEHLKKVDNRIVLQFRLKTCEMMEFAKEMIRRKETNRSKVARDIINEYLNQQR
jgi:ribosomal protein L44E